MEGCASWLLVGTVDSFLLVTLGGAEGRASVALGTTEGRGDAERLTGLVLLMMEDKETVEGVGDARLASATVWEGGLRVGRGDTLLAMLSLPAVALRAAQSSDAQSSISEAQMASLMIILTIARREEISKGRYMVGNEVRIILRMREPHEVRPRMKA